MEHQNDNTVHCSDPLLLCCVCDRLLYAPQLLRCLHSCCLACVRQSSADTSDEMPRATAKFICPICDEATSEVTSSDFVAGRLSRHRAIASSRVCGVCADQGDANQAAEVWCSSCRFSLCAACMRGHASFHKAHSTTPIEKVISWDDACPALAPLCSIHGRPFEGVCFTCKACRCTECWATCSNKAHDVKHLSDPTAASRAEGARSEVASLEQTLHSKVNALDVRKRLEADLQCALDSDLKKLMKMKLRLLAAIDTASVAVEQRLRDAYGGLRAKAEIVSHAASTMERKVGQASSYGRSVRETGLPAELFNEERNVIARMTSLSAELDRLKRPLEASECVAFDSTLPDDDAQLVDLVTSWIGSPWATTGDLCTRTKVREDVPARASFGDLCTRTKVREDVPARASFANPLCHPKLLGASTTSYVHLPIECCDVSLTEDGRLLLAAGEAGLLEYCMSGHELSRWRCRDSEDDEVSAIEALGDGRVAVGVRWERLVVLLKRVAGAAAVDDAWTEEWRLDVLRQSPSSLAAYDDTLAVAMLDGEKVELIALDSGKCLSALEREYAVQSVTVTDNLIVTVSAKEVKVREAILTTRKQAYVLDAHTRSGDRRQWRYELPRGEEARDICADVVSGVLYVAAIKSDYSSGRVAVVGLMDGRELHQDLIGCDWRLLPAKLALSRMGQRAALAMLCYDTESRRWGEVAMIHQFSQVT